MPTEAQDQAALVQWLRLRGFKDHEFHHSPNENASPAQYRRKQKRLGVSKGFPDLIIVRPFVLAGYRYNGVALELKRGDKKNRPTVEQRQWLETFQGAGFVSWVCHGFDQAMRLLLSIGY